MTRWKVYYDSREPISSDECEPTGLSKRGVQAIVQPDVSTGFRILTDDYYLWSPDDTRWYCADMFGLWDYLVQPGWRLVLFGRSVTEVEFEAVYRDARDDSLFEEKSEWREREHRPNTVHDGAV